MKRRAGFTLAELLIAMAVMTILIVLAVVNLRSNQAAARDEQRKTSVQIIAQQLENFYEAGTDTQSPGQYPTTVDMDSESDIRTSLPSLDTKVLRAPNVAASDPVSLIVAANASIQTPTASQYIYQPLRSDGTLCTSTSWNASSQCRKFKLYYALEDTAGTQVIVSKHQ